MPAISKRGVYSTARGEEDIVLDLYDGILAGERHYEIRLLHTETSHFRLFESWRMIFNDLNYPSDEVGQKRDFIGGIFHESATVLVP